MRIAVSGTHRVGKTTLAEALVDALPGYRLVPEPYYLLEDEGHAFGETPVLEDYEAQLERSLQCVEENGERSIFDRCPLDFLGYLRTHREAGTFRLEDWLPRIQEAVAVLDLVILVPIESPERIALSPPDAEFRAQVDGILADIILDDSLGLGFDALAVSGSVDERLRQVIRRLE
jgi:hypothetical protein